MKNFIMIGSALLVLSSSAYASTARLLALGMNETDNEGMYYISDSRDMFLNPAYINTYYDFATIEWGDIGTQIKTQTTTATSPATLNTTTSPKAQGGAFKKMGNFVYGAYFGNESNTSSLLRIAGTSSAASINPNAAGGSKMLQTADNQVDLFFGGDNGLKWAVNPTFAFGKNETRTSKDSAAAIRVGVMENNWDAHLNLSLKSKSDATDTVNFGASSTFDQEFKGKLGFHVGGSYLLDSKNRIFGYVKHYGWEQTDNFANYTALRAAIVGSIGPNNIGQTGTVKGDFTNYYLGWGRDFDVNNGDKIFTSLAAKKTDVNLKFINKSEIRQLIIPVTIGYEAKATEWLTLRGSIVQNIWGQRDNKNINNNAATTGTQLNPVAQSTIASIYGGSGKATVENSTAINAGATLAFGNLSVDGLIGTTGADRAGGTTTVGKKSGVLALDNLETSVAATYKF
jgi:hypothetical protein